MTTHAPSSARSQRAARGIALSTSAAVAYGCSPVLVTFALDDGLDSTVLLLIRAVIASCALWLLWSVVRRGTSADGASRSLIVRAVGFGAFVYALQVLLFTFALERIGASLAIMIFYSYPALIVLGSRVLGREALTRRRLAAVSLVIAGIVALAGGDGGGRLDALGLCLALGSALACAVVTLGTASFVERLQPVQFAAALTSGTAVAFVAPVLVAGAAIEVPGGAWPYVIALALIPSVLGTWLMALGVMHAGPSLAGLALTLEPVVAVAMAAVLLDESLGAVQVLGAGLVLGGIAVAFEHGRAKTAAAAARHVPE